MFAGRGSFAGFRPTSSAGGSPWQSALGAGGAIGLAEEPDLAAATVMLGPPRRTASSAGSAPCSPDPPRACSGLAQALPLPYHWWQTSVTSETSGTPTGRPDVPDVTGLSDVCLRLCASCNRAILSGLQPLARARHSVGTRRLASELVSSASRSMVTNLSSVCTFCRQNSVFRGCDSVHCRYGRYGR